MKIPKSVMNILAALESAGFEGHLVGGCVRDALAGAEPKDYDVCTDATPGEMLSVFSAFPVFSTGLKHGTLTVRSAGMSVEVTTYRVDGAYSDNRRPDHVRFTASLTEDLSRRDFTINAMAADKNGKVIDCFGGRQDLAAGILRCVGDPEARFGEDSLRILRAIRFASVLGFTVENGTAAAMRSFRSLLSNVSAERVREELTKTLCGKSAGRVLREFRDVFLQAVPEAAPMSGRPAGPDIVGDVWERTADGISLVPVSPHLRWAFFMHDAAMPGPDHGKDGAVAAKALVRRLKFDNRTAGRIVLLVARHEDPVAGDDVSAMRMLHAIGEENLRDLISLRQAVSRSGEGVRAGAGELTLQRLQEVLSRDPCYDLKKLAVTGRDLEGLGYAQGPAIGQALEFMLEGVIEGRCPNDRKALISYLEAAK